MMMITQLFEVQEAMDPLSHFHFINNIYNCTNKTFADFYIIKYRPMLNNFSPLITSVSSARLATIQDTIRETSCPASGGRRVSRECLTESRGECEYIGQSLPAIRRT